MVEDDPQFERGATIDIEAVGGGDGGGDGGDVDGVDNSGNDDVSLTHPFEERADFSGLGWVCSVCGHRGGEKRWRCCVCLSHDVCFLCRSGGTKSYSPLSSISSVSSLLSTALRAEISRPRNFIPTTISTTTPSSFSAAAAASSFPSSSSSSIECTHLEENLGLMPGCQLYEYQATTLLAMIQRETGQERFVCQLDDSDYTLSASGILGEPPGCGKTLICIALVLHSLGTVASHPLARVRYDCPEAAVLLQAAAPRSIAPPIRWGKPVFRHFCAVPSLRSLCESLIKRRSLPVLPLPVGVQRAVLEALPPAYYLSPDEVTALASPLRRGRAECRVQQQRLVMGLGTLIVLPEYLIYQWKAEFERWIDPVRVRMTIAAFPTAESVRSSVAMLTPERLSLQHVVLVTYPAFSAHAALFSSIHWLRLIVDEGHIAGKHSQQAQKLKRLAAERRWICSGTPFALGSVASSSLKRLVNFLDFKPYNQPSTWKRMLLATGPFDQMLDLILFRNSPLSGRSNLAPCASLVVYLDPSLEERLIYNEVVCQIRINMLTSEFVGPDYILNPKNGKSAAQALASLQATGVGKSRLYSKERLLALSTAISYLLKARHARKFRSKPSSCLFCSALQQGDARCACPQCDALFLGCIQCHLCSDSLCPDCGHWALSLQQHGDTAWPTPPPTQSSTPRWLSPVDIPDVVLSRKPTLFLGEQAFQELEGVIKLMLLCCVPSTEQAESPSKLKYLLECVQTHLGLDPANKVIIFSRLHNTLWWVHELLTRHRLPFTRLDRGYEARKANARMAALQFQQDPSVRIIVVDLKYVSNGLNLYAANLVLFMEPVPDPAMLQQAIGRAVRIGQTRSVQVETLVLADTIEDTRISPHSPSADQPLPDSTTAPASDRKDLARTHRTLRDLSYLAIPVAARQGGLRQYSIDRFALALDCMPLSIFSPSLQAMSEDELACCSTIQLR